MEIVRIAFDGEDYQIQSSMPDKQMVIKFLKDTAEYLQAYPIIPVALPDDPGTIESN